MAVMNRLLLVTPCICTGAPKHADLLFSLSRCALPFCSKAVCSSILWVACRSGSLIASCSSYFSLLRCGVTFRSLPSSAPSPPLLEQHASHKTAPHFCDLELSLPSHRSAVGGNRFFFTTCLCHSTMVPAPWLSRVHKAPLNPYNSPPPFRPFG